MLTAQDHAAVIRAHYDAFNRRDNDKGQSLVTNDVKWTNVPFNLQYTGHKGYRESLDNWITALPDCKVEITNLVAGTDWAAVEFTGRGTHTGTLVGPSGTMPATQQKLELKCCEVMRIQDGQIAEARLYFDAASLLRQLGLLTHAPTPARAQS